MDTSLHKLLRNDKIHGKVYILILTGTLTTNYHYA